MVSGEGEGWGFVIRVRVAGLGLRFVLRFVSGAGVLLVLS